MTRSQVSTKIHETDLQSVYASLIGEGIQRLNAAENFLHQYQSVKETPQLESAILQIRKSLELIAMAAIAPDKKEYAAFRATADKDQDFTKDYHASKIFGALSRINPDFYPRPLLPATRMPDGTWHFGQKQSGFLSKKQFERVYDRLGKHLHAHNPWGANKNLQNLAVALPGIIGETRGLLQLHARIIRTSEFQGVWVVEAESPFPQVITGAAYGPFIATAAKKTS
jgi:hypothetical protein